MKLWVLVVRELVYFAQRLCDRLKAESLGVEPFVCAFSFERDEVFFNIGGADSPVVRVWIHFKSDWVAFKVFAGLKSIPEAFAEGWMWVEGPVEYSVAVTRFFERFEAVVFPYYLFPHLYRGKPSFSLKRVGLRGLLYLYAVVAPFIIPLRWGR